MSDTTVNTKLNFTMESADGVVLKFEEIAASAEDAQKAIAAADSSATSLGAAVQGIPDIPLQQSSDKFQRAAEKTNDALEKVSDKAVDAGKATEMLYSALDSVIPGLGGITESLISMNPIAIAGTAAITGIVLVLGEMQRQAEEARKAAEEATKAEAQRAYDQMSVQQRLNLALSGDKTARENLIKDLAAANAEAARLQAQGADILKQRNEAQAEFDRLLAIQWDDNSTLEQVAKAYDAGEEARLKVNAANAAIGELSPTIEKANTNFELLNDAVNQLNLSEEELNALRLSETQGIEGTIAALGELNEKQEKAKAFFQGIVGGIKEGLEGAKDGIVKGAKDLSDKIAAETAKRREEAEKNLLDISEKLTTAEQDRGAVLANRLIEDQRAAELGKLNDRLAQAQAYDAAVAKNQKLKEIQAQGNEAEVQAQQKFMEGQQKLLAGYLKAEKNATEDYSRDRVRKLEDLYNTLNDLASKRDVAAFVNARRSGLQDIGRGDEDAGAAARRRREEYEAAAKDQEVAFNKESAQRRSQLQQRLDQEAQVGQQQIKQADIVQRQIAELRDRWAKQDLAARRAQEDASYRQTIDILQKKRAEELKITAGAAAGVIEIVGKIGQAATQVKGFLNSLSAKAIPKFASGTDYIQRTGLAVVHQGEAIIPASQNTPSARAGGRGLGGVIIQALNVGKIATQDDIDRAVDGVVGALVSFGANTNL